MLNNVMFNTAVETCLNDFSLMSQHVLYRFLCAKQAVPADVILNRAFASFRADLNVPVAFGDRLPQEWVLQ